MTSKEHKKHAKLSIPQGGKFHRNELAIMGAPCGLIENLAKGIAEQLGNLKIGYVDADHGESDEKPIFYNSYSDKIGHHTLTFHSDQVDYECRALLAANDLTLINGNHFEGEKQIVIINEKKKESLERKLDKLTNVQFFILDQGQESLFDYLNTHNESFQSTPTYKIDDIAGIAGHILKLYDEQTPPLKGLVLAGGKSMRMGTDKSRIDYHGKPQAVYMAELLNQFCEEVYISKASYEDPIEGYEVMPDRFVGLGPYGGILSAMQSDPNAAWLVVATDIPLLDRTNLEYLVSHRKPGKVATCYHNPETNFPEPLITIWEPRAYPRLLHFLSLGYSCPRKALINSDIKEIDPTEAQVLSNANTPEEMAKLKALING